MAKARNKPDEAGPLRRLNRMLVALARPCGGFVTSELRDAVHRRRACRGVGASNGEHLRLINTTGCRRAIARGSTYYSVAEPHLESRFGVRESLWG
jgi:hypothetical protein